MDDEKIVEMFLTSFRASAQYVVNENHMVDFLMYCHICDRPVQILSVPLEGIKACLNNGSIQRCLPKVSAPEREMFISGTCDYCFNEMFGEEE